MNYRIIDAQQAHLEQLHEIENECFSMPWTVELLRGQLKDDRHEFIAAVDEEQNVLGYVGMMYILDEGYISNVAVSEKYRRQGIADALIAELMNTADKLELAFVTLEVRASNEPAIKLYEKHGFAPVGRRKNYYDLPKEDALLMTHFLKRGTGIENTGI